jgi:antitoxin CcdA
MKHARISANGKRPVNISVDADLVTGARELGLGISRICEEALAAAVKKERVARWQEENREAIEGWNQWVAENGLPLAKYRMF